MNNRHIMGDYAPSERELHLWARHAREHDMDCIYVFLAGAGLGALVILAMSLLAGGGL